MLCHLGPKRPGLLACSVGGEAHFGGKGSFSEGLIRFSTCKRVIIVEVCVVVCRSVPGAVRVLPHEAAGAAAAPGQPHPRGPARLAARRAARAVPARDRLAGPAALFVRGGAAAEGAGAPGRPAAGKARAAHTCSAKSVFQLPQQKHDNHSGLTRRTRIRSSNEQIRWFRGNQKNLVAQRIICWNNIQTAQQKVRKFVTGTKSRFCRFH